jgi:allantoin racemase
MRILVINPNTTVAVTDTIVAEARRSAPPQVEITGVTARFGSPFIQTPDESETARQAVLELVSRLASGFDAVVIAAFSDPGLAEAREMSPVPVVGIAESAILTALMCGGRFAIVTLGPALRPLLEGAAVALGCAGRLDAIHILDTGTGIDARSAGAAATIQRDRGEALAVLCGRAAAAEGVRSIILGGGPLAGLAHRIRVRVPVPLLDGTACAINHAATLARLGLRTPEKA